MNVVCIIQARVGSTRLPKKVLREICGKTVLEHDVNRLKKIKNIDKIVIATTTEEKDIEIVSEAERLEINYFRGSENDVLSRYYYAAKEYNADVVVRVTSDCPLLDPDITEAIIQYYIDNMNKYVYVSNTLDRTYPRGLDTEVFSFDALEKAFKEAILESDREHVTPYIWRNGEMFNKFQYKNDKDYSDLRLTLDTEEDLKLIEEVYNYLYYHKNRFNLSDIINLFNIRPELKLINAEIEQKKVIDGLYLRKVTKGDCDLIFLWANDRETRKNSFNSNALTYGDHKQWFNKKIEDTEDFYILKSYEENLGQVRLDKVNEGYIISYSIDSKYRGKGYGKKILELLEQKISLSNQFKTFIAYVKKGNMKSVKIFEDLNYNKELENDTYKFVKKIGDNIA